MNLIWKIKKKSKKIQPVLLKFRSWPENDGYVGVKKNFFSIFKIFLIWLFGVSCLFPDECWDWLQGLNAMNYDDDKKNSYSIEKSEKMSLGVIWSTPGKMSSPLKILFLHFESF